MYLFNNDVKVKDQNFENDEAFKQIALKVLLYFLPSLQSFDPPK
jgi:hypothetical protein